MNYYNEIKNELINNEINRKVKSYSINKSDLNTYYNVGKLLLAAGNQYGESIIKEYSIKLTEEFGSGYSQRNLRNMRQFYKVSQKWQTVSAKLSWSHYCEILWFDDNKFQYYVKIAELNNLSIRQLRKKIKSNEYERLPEFAKNKLLNQAKQNVVDFVKNPIKIKNDNKYDILSEKILQKLILEDIENFLEELGIGFTFIKSEYPIKLGNRYNYIDLLLYNIKYKCYVVVELKVTELKKEHTGQIMTYMNYIDKNIKTVEENDTVGIIICKQDNEYVIKYCSDDRIIAREYELVWYNIIGCDNIFKNVEELRNLIKLEKTKEKIIKSQMEYLNSDNSYGHPNKEVLSTLEYSKIYRTDIDGSIVVKIKNNKFNIETCSP